EGADDVRGVGEGADLAAVSVHADRLVAHDLVEEDGDGVAVRVAHVLPLAVDVVHAQGEVRQALQLYGDGEFALHGEFRVAVAVGGDGPLVLAHGDVSVAVHGDRRGEAEEPDLGGQRGVDQVDAAEQ